MTVLDCYLPEWQAAEGAPPFLAYSSTAPQVVTEQPDNTDVEALHALPQSQMEQRVAEYAALVQQQAKALRKKFKGIHAHDWMSLPAALEAKKITGRPVVAHVHSTELDRIPHGNGSPFITQVERQGWQQSDAIIAVSFYTKQLLIEKYGIDEKKIFVVHNGVPPLASPADPGPHHFASKRPVVVFMGRLTVQKGPEYFLQLAKALLKEKPETLFVVAGHGDMYHELLFQTAYQQLSASVLFTGFARNRLREQLLNRADIFIMPSVSEPFGLVALEAAQRHTPVIVSKNTGVIEVMPSAIAVDFWDIHAMTRTVIELLNNREASQRQVVSQLGELDKVTWGKAASNVKDIYRQLFTGD
jgi:hypothetical protein